MIQIDRIRMRLPSGFEHRSLSITRQIGKILESKQVAGDRHIDSVSISPQKINAATSDEEIAQMIVNQIINNYNGEAI